MKVLVCAASKYGATSQIARAVADVLAERGCEVPVLPAQEVGAVEEFDAVVLGSAVYMGQWMKPARELAERSSQLAAPSNLAVAAAISRYRAADGDLAPGAPAGQVASARQMTWLNNYAKALAASSAKFTPTSITVTAGSYGPVPTIIAAELAIANNGSLDGYLQGSQQQLSTNTTMGTMFFSDGTLWGTIAEAQGVGGDQWGVMNELWNFPGQVWLWLYAGMYQIPALASNNANLDLDVGLLMILFGFLLPMFAPWIPGINRIPRWIPLYKIIYRNYYRSAGGRQPPARAPSEPAAPSE